MFLCPRLRPCARHAIAIDAPSRRAGKFGFIRPRDAKSKDDHAFFNMNELCVFTASLCLRAGCLSDACACDNAITDALHPGRDLGRRRAPRLVVAPQTPSPRPFLSAAGRRTSN